MAADTERHETPGVATKRVEGAMLVILGLLIAVSFGLQLFFQDRVGKTHVTPASFPEPAIMATQRAERMALEARQRRELAGGSGRMPIDAAMRAIAAKGPHGRRHCFLWRD